jgi:hypothetical protein
MVNSGEIGPCLLWVGMWSPCWSSLGTCRSTLLHYWAAFPCWTVSGAQRAALTDLHLTQASPMCCMWWLADALSCLAKQILFLFLWNVQITFTPPIHCAILSPLLPSGKLGIDGQTTFTESVAYRSSVLMFQWCGKVQGCTAAWSVSSQCLLDVGICV